MTFRRYVLVLAFAVVGSSCGIVGAGSSGPQTRTVLADFSHDEFASYFLQYFPQSVQVRQGDTVVFRQTWTGEPHSVTMGRRLQKTGELMKPYLKLLMEEGFEALPDEPPAEILEEEEGLPRMFGDEDEVAQNGAQPCYLDEGMPAEDPDTPCASEDQVQPPFNGRQNYYNSGFIPYEGPRGNTFTVPIDEDATPGEYFYYCNLHGQLMGGYIDIKPKGSEIPSQDEVNRQARAEIEQMAEPLAETFRAARDGRLEVPDDRREQLLEKGQKWFKGNLAGLFSFSKEIQAGINEFIPRTIRVRRGQPVTWTMFGGHSISFNVPRYFPIFEVDEDGTVRRNPRLDPPAGGSPPVPEQEHGEPPEGEPPPEGEDEDAGPPPEPPRINAGTWDGEGFYSSGVIWGEPFAEYTLRFSKPGTYKYACLIHPPMVATLEVT